MSAVASRREGTPRILAACSHCARRLAYSPPVSSCFTLVLMMRSAMEASVIGTNSGLARTAIQQQQVVLLAHHGDELVHDAARHPGVVVLGLLAEQRLVHRVELLARDGFQQGRGGDFQRRAAGQPAAQRNRGVNQARQSRLASPRGPGSPRSPRPGNSTTPPSAAGFTRLAQIKADRAVARRGAQLNLRCPVGRGRGGDDRVAVNGHRQHEAVVVIGVLADDVYAPGRGGDPAGRAPIGLAELLRGVRGRVRCRVIAVVRTGLRTCRPWSGGRSGPGAG